MRSSPWMFVCVAAGCARPGADQPAPSVRVESLVAPSAPSSSASAAASGAAPHARRGRRSGTDVTFYATSDLHFGEGYPDVAKLEPDPRKHPAGLERVNLTMIERMNTLEGVPYPARGSGRVGHPLGVLAAGDLTNWSRPVEWSRFVELYGLNGTEGALHIPMFEVVGNHDRIAGPHIEQAVAARHGGRFYSWDWDDVHVVALGEAPDDEGLEFLAHDLDTLEPDVPVVIYFHLAIQGPFSDGWFATGGFRESFAALLPGHNVLAILHGHHHATGHYLWNGIDVYKVGAVKDGPHVFTVLHVKDDQTTVGVYDYDASRWVAWSEKATRR